MWIENVRTYWLKLASGGIWPPLLVTQHEPCYVLGNVMAAQLGACVGPTALEAALLSGDRSAALEALVTWAPLQSYEATAEFCLDRIACECLVQLVYDACRGAAWGDAFVVCQALSKIVVVDRGGRHQHHSRWLQSRHQDRR